MPKNSSNPWTVGQELVEVAEVILAELTGRVAEVLHEVRDARIFGLQADVRARQADLGQPGADGRLAGDERRAPRRAALLAIPVGEPRTFSGDAVDVRRVVAHDPAVVTTRVKPPDVVAHDDEDVGLLLRPSRKPLHQITHRTRRRARI